MLNTEVPKNYIFPLPEEPLRPARPARPINGWSVRPRRYTRPVGRRGGMRGASRDLRSPRDSWREYGTRGRRDEVNLRGGRGNMRSEWGIRGREIRGEWSIRGRNSFGRRERRRDDISFRRRGMNIRGMHNERIRDGRIGAARGIPRGPRGYRSGRVGR